MHRSELEDQLGISWNKVRDIIRRSDYDNDGVVDYRDFLDTVKNYRLNTEQTSTLKSLVRAFAYAEEFSCCPPRLKFLTGCLNITEKFLLKLFFMVLTMIICSSDPQTLERNYCELFFISLILNFTTHSILVKKETKLKIMKKICPHTKLVRKFRIQSFANSNLVKGE